MIERRHVMGTKNNKPVEYLRFTALEDGTFSFNSLSYSGDWTYIEYSVDEGTTWTRLNKSDVSATGVLLTTPTVTTGNSCLWRGNMKQVSGSTGASYRSNFSSTGRFNVSGNILTWLNPKGKSAVYARSFQLLFYNCTNLVDASELVMPNSTYEYCCYYMFQGCTSLTTAPEILPATQLSVYCYYGLFSGCTSLVTPPELPATTLSASCYYSMFSGCTSLITPPELPATTLAMSCYRGMFQRCTSLESIPELSATILASACYQEMFQYCTSLVSVAELPATTLDSNCYYYMFNGCTALTTVPAILPATTLANNCYTGMFYDCQSLTSPPKLPATTLVNRCYYYMFYNCKALTTAPVLPAQTTVTNCYYRMFYQCSHLNFIKCLATTFGSGSCTDWTSGVASSGTFVKDANTTWTTGTSGIPTSWIQMDSRACILFENTISVKKSETTANIKAIIDADHYTISNSNNWFTVTTTGSMQIDIAVTISENNTGLDRSGMFTINCYDENNNLLDTGTVTVTQSTVAATYSVNLNNGQWVWDSSLNCYKSDSNYHVTNGSASMSIEISGYTEFTIKVRTYGEKNYDYLTVGKLDQIPTRSNSTSGTNYWTGYGKSSATTWYDVTFSNIDGGAHTINLLYAKDGRTNTYDDRAYMQIITE